MMSPFFGAQMARESTEIYRANTKTAVIYNSRMVRCAGPCNRTRSEGQFAKGDSFCKICRLRA